MTLVNNTCIPSCNELAGILTKYGNKPLFSGKGWMAVVGFKETKDGIQVIVKRCAKPGEDPHSNRE